MAQLSKEAVLSDLHHIRTLQKEQGWDVFNRYLEAAGEDWTTRLTNDSSSSLDGLRYAQGVLAGLRIAQQIPQNIELLASRIPKA